MKRSFAKRIFNRVVSQVVMKVNNVIIFLFFNFRDGSIKIIFQ